MVIFGVFLVELTLLSKMNSFSRNLNHPWKCRVQKGTLQKILVKIFWNFAVFQCRFDLPQVKQKLICRIINLVYELSHNLPKDLRLKIFGNSKILEKSQVEQRHNLVPSLSFKNSTLPLAVRKTCKSRYQTSLSIQFYWTFLFCSKYFFRDCSC